LEHHHQNLVWDPEIPHTRPNPADHLRQEDVAASMSKAATLVP
jgi:hypothetical protein